MGTVRRTASLRERQIAELSIHVRQRASPGINTQAALIRITDVTGRAERLPWKCDKLAAIVALRRRRFAKESGLGR
jgi:hypothetical protein